MHRTLTTILAAMMLRMDSEVNSHISTTSDVVQAICYLLLGLLEMHKGILELT